MRTQEQIVEDLAGILCSFRGREYSDPIGPETLFFADLGFASIDAVILGETLESHYGQRFPFRELLAEAGGQQARDIEVGRLAAFLSRHME